mgnify:CR=1 FL=1
MIRYLRGLVLKKEAGGFVLLAGAMSLMPIRIKILDAPVISAAVSAKTVSP